MWSRRTCVCVFYLTPYVVRQREDRRGAEKDKWLKKWMHSCIYTQRKKAKYSSSSPSHCSILLQGKGLSRHVCRPKGGYLFNNSIQPCFLACDKACQLRLSPHIPVSSRSCLPLHLYQRWSSQQPTQVQSPFNIHAHAGPKCVLARAHAAWTEVVLRSDWRSVRLIPHARRVKAVRYWTQESQLGSGFSHTRYSWWYLCP